MSAPDRDPCSIRRLTRLSNAEARGLAVVLTDCVDGGASVGFMRPLSMEQALAFWRRVGRDVERGARALLIAEDAEGIVGTVQIVLEQPDNQPHRADLSKMLVHRRARRRGIGAALMRAAEDAARRSRKSLLVPDTASDDAERLYARMGWTLVGVIPDYALWPGGGFCPTSVFYRKLANAEA